jgi:hypothetical protein
MKKTIRLTESDLVKIVKRIINEQTEGESEVIRVLDDKYGLSDELKQEISNALKSSECKNVFFQKLKIPADGLAQSNRLVLNPNILNYSLGKALFVLFHEMAHQYQFKKYGKEKMGEMYTEEISLSDAAKFLQKTENVADEFAVRKLKSLERKGLVKLTDYDIKKAYEHMSISQIEHMVNYFRNVAKQSKSNNIDEISEYLYNMVKMESSDNVEVKNHQKDTNRKSDINVEKTDDKTTTLQNLEKIDGDLDLSRSNTKSLGNLTSVGGDLDLNNSKIQSLGDLTSVDGNLDLFGTEIQSLGDLTSVGGDLFLGHGRIKSLGNLTSVGGALELQNSNIKSLGNLTSVGGDLYLMGTPLSREYSEEEIRSMVEVGGKVFL